jgi:hypothetical protein
MDRLKGIGSFLFVTVIIFGVLRLAHVVIPVFYPKVLTGPFSLDRVEAVEEYTGFAPRLPFYRPEDLGARPVSITVTRRPYPKVVIHWQGEHFLRLAEQQGGEIHPSGPATRPLEDHPEGSWRSEGRTHEVVLKKDDLWIEVRTDLSEEDARRIVDTLRPYEELL